MTYSQIPITLLRRLQAAIVLFTCLPLASNKLKPEHFCHATQCLVPIGIIVGAISTASYYLTTMVLHHDIACLIAMIVAIIVTGAIHEDGLADCSDALFLHHNTEKRLAIMKDSRLGTFAVLALICVFSLKLLLLQSLHHDILLVLFLYPPFARLSPLLVMKIIPPVQTNNSKITQQLGESHGIILQITSLLILGLVLSTPVITALLFLVVIISTAVCAWHFNRSLKGYNGDCLGFTEQISECAILLTFAITLMP